MATPEEGDLYGGFCDVDVIPEEFDFGHGVSLTRTRAHFMRPCLMTFERPDDSFPAMQSARGSYGFDLVAELHVPPTFDIPNWFDRANTIWWLSALLRLRATPRLRVPVLSNRSFSKHMSHRPLASFWPVETESERTRMLLDPTSGHSISNDDLAWVRENWIEAGLIMNRSREFNLAFQAFDQSSFARDPMLALLLLWGALEAIFSPGATELRFRVSANIATFLEPPSQCRAEVQRTTAKLYDARSAAAHGRRTDAEKPLIATYALLKRVLLKIITEKEMPTVAVMEDALFRGV